MRHIATNAGAEASIVVSKVKAGVIDPARVVCSAAHRSASLLLTTEALISELPEETAA